MIVGRDGIAELSFQALCARAGLEPVQARAHYADATACLYATYDAVALSIYEDFAHAFAAETGWRKGLRRAGVTLLKRLSARPAEARLCFVEVLYSDHELRRRREANRRRLVDLFVSELGRRRDHPERFRMQLELLIGAGFHAIAHAVARGKVDKLAALEPELATRAFVFEPAIPRFRGSHPRARRRVNPSKAALRTPRTGTAE
jgi:hypothetical protein